MDNRADLERSIEYARSLVHTIKDCNDCDKTKTISSLQRQLNALADENEALLEENKRLFSQVAKLREGRK